MKSQKSPREPAKNIKKKDFDGTNTYSVYLHYAEMFSSYTNEELIETFNSEVGKVS